MRRRETTMASLVSHFKRVFTTAFRLSEIDKCAINHDVILQVELMWKALNSSVSKIIERDIIIIVTRWTSLCSGWLLVDRWLSKSFVKLNWDFLVLFRKFTENFPDRRRCHRFHRWRCHFDHFESCFFLCSFHFVLWRRVDKVNSTETENTQSNRIVCSATQTQVEQRQIDRQATSTVAKKKRPICSTTTTEN